MGIFSSFCLLLWRMTPFPVALINGFVLETGVSSLFLWRKPHPRKTETNTTYRIVTATSIHFTCTNQELELHKTCFNATKPDFTSYSQRWNTIWAIMCINYRSKYIMWPNIMGLYSPWETQISLNKNLLSEQEEELNLSKQKLKGNHHMNSRVMYHCMNT